MYVNDMVVERKIRSTHKIVISKFHVRKKLDDPVYGTLTLKTLQVVS